MSKSNGHDRAVPRGGPSASNLRSGVATAIAAARADAQRRTLGGEIHKTGAYSRCAEGVKSVTTGRLVARFENRRGWRRWRDGSDRILVCVHCKARFDDSDDETMVRMAFSHHFKKHAAPDSRR